MEEKFISHWLECRRQAAEHGVRLRPISREDGMQSAHRMLSGSRVSDGFDALSQKGLLCFSLEALAVDQRFTCLFSDQEANNALTRLMEQDYFK